jgi:ferredoxin
MSNEILFSYPRRAGRVRLELRVPTDHHLNLLAHAQCEEATLGSRCGGHGKCGADKVRVSVDGDRARMLSPVTEPERRLLSAAELASGVRLACQCFPEQDDITIRVEVLSQDALLPEEQG